MENIENKYIYKKFLKRMKTIVLLNEKKQTKKIFTGLKVNLGCGENYYKNYINIDKIDNIIINVCSNFDDLIFINPYNFMSFLLSNTLIIIFFC